MSLVSTNQSKLLLGVAVSNCATELSSVNVTSAATDCWTVAAENAARMKLQKRTRATALEMFRDVEIIRLNRSAVFSEASSTSLTLLPYPRGKESSSNSLNKLAIFLPA